MTKQKKPSEGIATYSDHEVITPENRLRKMVSVRAMQPGEEDPVKRAEKALSDLSSEFAIWMNSECERLDAARRAVAGGGFTETNKEALFHAAHDIKGEAATFGYPFVAHVAESLCRLIEYTPEARRIPIVLVDQHVDAVRAIHREYARSDAKELAVTLIERLRVVTEEFLTHENRDRPEVLAQIRGPSIVPK